jgi:biotin synthase
MCYAIPGKITEISGNAVTVDYFGERRKARNDFFKLSYGEYVYAQGGFVVTKVSRREASEALKIWQELFFKLQETDLRLARKPKDLRSIANSLRQRYQGNSCCIHAIIEFSNYCSSDCAYCGLRADNKGLARYRMPVDEIVKTASWAVNELKFKAVVLQSGEDSWYDEEKLAEVVGRILRNSPALIILSIGERPLSLYKRLYGAGARGVLLRFETGNPGFYAKIKPRHKLEDRIKLIKKLRETGYLIMTGFLIGLPGQTQQDVLNDIKLSGDLGADMFSFGPFIPHSQTPLSGWRPPPIDEALDTIARARIMYPKARILVTTAIETLDKKEGLKNGLLSGGNSLMINVTSRKYRKLYNIYPDRAGASSESRARINFCLKLLRSLGRAPTDLGL